MMTTSDLRPIGPSRRLRRKANLSSSRRKEERRKDYLSPRKPRAYWLKCAEEMMKAMMSSSSMLWCDRRDSGEKWSEMKEWDEIAERISSESAFSTSLCHCCGRLPLQQRALLQWLLLLQTAPSNVLFTFTLSLALVCTGFSLFAVAARRVSVSAAAAYSRDYGCCLWKVRRECMNPSVRVREKDSNGARGYIVEVSECRDTRLLDSFLMITENVLVMRERGRICREKEDSVCIAAAVQS